MRTAAIPFLALLVLGCGGGNDAPDDQGPTLSIIGTRVRMTCSGGDCFAGIIQDDGFVHLNVWRTIEGVTEQRNEKRAQFPITDVEVVMGGGNDVFRMYDRSIAGTLTVSMGGGDDDVDLDDGAAFGTTRIDLGSGDDKFESNASLPAQRFRIDAGPGDDSVSLNTVLYPNANAVIGGDGTDTITADAELVERLDVEGFEERNLY